MEALLWIAAFCAWQCLVRVPGGAVLAVRRRGGRLRVTSGPALRPLLPWPLGAGHLAASLPFEVTPTEALASSPLRRLGRPDPPGETRAAALDPAQRFEATGTLVRAEGGPLARALSAEHAVYLADLLTRLATLDPDERTRRVRATLRRSLSKRALVATLEETDRALRPLGWACASLLGLLPAALLVRILGPPDAVWLGLAGLALAIDLVALACVWRAHTRLYPTRRGERWTLVLTLALFPPALLRAGDLVARGRLCAFHPAAFAALDTRRERLLDLLRRERARLRHPVWRRLGQEHADRAAARDRFLATSEAALLALARSAGVAPAELDAAPFPPDPDAASYCPLCFAQFRPGYARCNDCALPTLTLAGEPPPGAALGWSPQPSR